MVAIATLSGKRIVVDPGHGGKFTGAVGPGGTQEKAVTLGVCLELVHDLVELGADVKLTRDSDSEVIPGASVREDLKARVDIANNWPADLFISVHANSADHQSAQGTETYHSNKASDRSKALAKLVQQSLIAHVQLTDRGVKSSDFYVIKNTKMPAILVETAFISNPEEEKKLADPATQKLFAKSIATGVSQYLNIEANLKPDPPTQPDVSGTDILLAPGDPQEMLLARTR